MNKKEIFNAGYSRGYAAGDNIDLVDIGDYTSHDGDRVKVTSDNWMEIHSSFAWEAESNDRQFSPFEFLAHELNEIADSKSYEVWDVFDEGVNKGVADALKKRWKTVSYKKEDYAKSFDGTAELFEACWRMLLAYSKGSEVEWNDKAEVDERLEEFASQLVNDSSSRFYIYG